MMIDLINATEKVCFPTNHKHMDVHWVTGTQHGLLFSMSCDANF